MNNFFHPSFISDQFVNAGIIGLEYNPIKDKNCAIWAGGRGGTIDPDREAAICLSSEKTFCLKESGQLVHLEEEQQDFGKPMIFALNAKAFSYVTGIPLNELGGGKSLYLIACNSFWRVAA